MHLTKSKYNFMHKNVLVKKVSILQIVYRGSRFQLGFGYIRRPSKFSVVTALRLSVTHLVVQSGPTTQHVLTEVSPNPLAIGSRRWVDNMYTLDL